MKSPVSAIRERRLRALYKQAKLGYRTSATVLTFVEPSERESVRRHLRRYSVSYAHLLTRARPFAAAAAAVITVLYLGALLGQ
jgi:hypothetical protein